MARRKPREHCPTRRGGRLGAVGCELALGTAALPPLPALAAEPGAWNGLPLGVVLGIGLAVIIGIVVAGALRLRRSAEQAEVRANVQADAHPDPASSGVGVVGHAVHDNAHADADLEGTAAGESSLSGMAEYESFHQLVEQLDLSRSPQERSYIEVISAMVATAHARDHETIGHSFRVARYAVTLARKLGLDEAMQTAVEWGALLHDVGKIGVPEEVLRKRGPLTAAEREVMRLHPRRGYQMLKSLLFLGTGLDVVLSHHERWDGRGYPNGLAGEDIPLSARIFAVVDTYDAMTSDRPYRAARPHAAAVEELLRVSGAQLDPMVVAVFLEISEARLERLRDLSQPVDVDSDSASFRIVLDEEPRSAASGGG